MRMRIRQVKPEFWSDAVMQTALGPAELLFYIGTWNLADDAGWMRWDLPEIAADLYRYQPASSRVKKTTAHAAKLIALGRIEVPGCGHAFIPTLGRHQRLSSETKRVYTFFREHQDRCGGDDGPAGSRGAPATPHRNGMGTERERKGIDPLPDVRDGLAMICELIKSKWHWSTVTAHQRAMIDDFALNEGEGQVGYARVHAILTATDESDPLAVLKAARAEARRRGRERADRQEAESRRWREVARSSPSDIASLGEVIAELRINGVGQAVDKKDVRT